MANAHGVDAVTNFMRNAWEPIAVPRWAITLKYLFFAIAGIIAFNDGVETISLATPQGYEPIWAACVVAGALTAAVGSFRPKWGWVEAIGASIVVAFLVVLDALIFARGAYAVGMLLIIVTILPGVRMAFLTARISLSWVKRETWQL